MDLILWRHAQAEAGEPDEGRELTPHGRKQAAKMAAWLDRSLPGGCRIVSSPALRCVQTAQALDRRFKIVDEVGPQATPQQVLQAIDWPVGRSPILLVGHQPWIGQVAALLLSGEARDWTVKKANAWWITNRQRGETEGLYLRAVLAPEFFND